MHLLHRLSPIAESNIDKLAFKNLFAHLPVGIAIIDSETELFCEVNIAFCEVTRTSADQLLNSHWSRLTFADDVRTRACHVALMNTGITNTFKIEERLILPDESTIWVEASVTRFDDQYYLYVIEDITPRKEEMLRLIEAKEIAERNIANKSQFIDMATHELRAPVTVLTLLLQFAQKQLSKGKPIGEDTLERLQHQSDRLNYLVSDLLQVSGLERGVVVLNKSATDLISLVAHCIADFQIQAPQRAFVFERPEQSIAIEIDAMKISQVLSNFLDNAIKYTPESSPIKVAIIKTKDGVRVSVTDQGEGISDQQRTELFSPFTRGNTEQVGRSTGLGLGLSICHGIIQLHQGKIAVDSEVSKGSTFYFELPFKTLSSEVRATHPFRISE